MDESLEQLIDQVGARRIHANPRVPPCSKTSTALFPILALMANFWDEDFITNGIDAYAIIFGLPHVRPYLTTTSKITSAGWKRG